MNGIGPSDLKSDNEFIVQICFYSKSDVKIGFKLDANDQSDGFQSIFGLNVSDFELKNAKIQPIFYEF